MTLASACAETSWRDAPADVQNRVVDLVADCVAVAALGSARPELQRLVAGHSRAMSEGGASVVGSPRGWPAGTAMFLNGAAVAADQLQDGHRMARGHPASHVVPAVLALAEERNASGEELLSAVLAGYESGVRVGLAMNGTPPGVHDIGTWGAVAAAAGVARLVAPGDEASCRRAIDLAASAVMLTEAATIFSGYTGGHAFLGASVQLGASLGLAGAMGLEPLDGALERHFAAVAARDWHDIPINNVTRSWPEFEILRGYVKTHPTCAHLHGVNDAVADLLHEGAAGGGLLVGDAIRAVEVRTFAGAAAFDAVADDDLAARFSVPTSVAIALVTGRLDETVMTTEMVRSPPVRELARRVSVVHDPEMDSAYPDGRPALIRVVLGDGTELTARSERPRGDADRALSRHELRGKARRLLTARFGLAGMPVLEAIHALADGGTPRGLGHWLREAVPAEGSNEQ